MAVMTTQPTDSVELAQKSQPLPSPDRMALDLEVNGTTNRDETTFNVVPAGSETSAQLASADLSPPLKDLSLTAIATNGGINLDTSKSDATTAEQNITAPPLVSQTSQTSGSAPDSSPLLDTITTTTFYTTSTEPQTSSFDQSTFLTSTDAAIDSAVDDTTPSTAVPPVIEAQESDLRDSTPPHLPQNTFANPNVAVALDLMVNSDALATEHSSQSNNVLAEAEANAQPLQLSSSGLPLPDSVSEKVQPLPNLDLDLSLPPPKHAGQDTSLNSTMAEENGAVPSNNAPYVDDTPMNDAPQASPSKVSREREDDEGNDPPAKRTKVEDDSLLDTINSSLADPSQNGDSAYLDVSPTNNATSKSTSSISPFQVKESVKILKNVIRTQDGKNFRAPVEQLWPTLAEAYAAKITNQIDIATMEKKLRDGVYSTMDDFKADVQLLEDNAITFNGKDHTVAKSAANVRESILTKISKLPAEPAAAARKEKKPKVSTPVDDNIPRAPAARRQSRGAGSGPAEASPAQTFALNPQTSTPLIRRDSTKGDGGRPKREIHPPKNKDLPYSVRPKSKKFDTELRWCAEVLSELKKPKYYSFASAFYQPVDPVALGIPTYFSVIKTPMDISTVQGKLDSGEYSNSKEFEKDVNLIFQNCYKFNPPPNPVHAWGKQLEDVYKSQQAKKAQWIADHQPAAPSHSPTPDSEEEESEDEPEVTVSSSASAALHKRLVEEQAKLIELMRVKGTDESIIQMQRDMVDIVQKRLQRENADAEAAAAATKKTKKAKVAKPAKKATAAPKKASTSAKKSSGSRSRYMGTLEKEVISLGIARLPEKQANSVLDMIKKDSPHLDVDGDGNVELDIDNVTVPTLWKIYDLVTFHAPDVEPEMRRQLQERDAPRAPARPAQKKKNKPMSKTEQELKIEQLRSTMQDFERQASGSQEPLPTVENNDESSGDESSDSEEE